MGGRTTSDLEIRLGTAADVPRILELVKLSLGTGTVPREIEYWNWKHSKSPFGESPVLLAESAGELVGLRVFMRWQWCFGDQVLDAVRAVDTATHPRWQGKGIFSRLTLDLLERVRGEGVSFVFNTPNEKSRPGYLKMGWKVVGRTDLLISPRHPIRIAKTLLRRGGRVGKSTTGGGEGRFAAAGALVGNPLVAHLVEAEQARVVRDGRLASPKSVDYLSWRYAEIPGYTYYSIESSKDVDGAALIFHFKERSGLRELRICEFFLGPGPHSRRIGWGLLRKLRRQANADYFSAASVPGTPQHTLLLTSGFMPAWRLGPIVTVRSVNPVDGLGLTHRRSWNASLGDLELF